MTLPTNARIAVASGKGGTGKTTIALALANSAGGPIQLLDCDVEEPNAHLFTGGELQSSEPVSVPVPVLDASRCDGCGACVDMCAFNAIAMARDVPLVFEDLCHGCGGCVRVCPRGALREAGRPIGVIEQRTIGDLSLLSGKLDVGRPTASPVIRAVKSRAASDRPVILDAPPGTSCPVIATLRGASFVLLVTEPTPFGLHDLTLAVEMVRSLGIPFGVVVNRAGIGGPELSSFCSDHHVPILAEIPDDRRVAEAYARGHIVVDAVPELRERFQQLLRKVGEASRGLS
jgi:MinD superfamily P-loop ATPase